MFFKAAVLVTIAARLAAAQNCVPTGVDIQDGGSYYLSPSSGASFSFKSSFAGTCSGSITPTIFAPDGTFYSCSSLSLSTTSQQESTCSVTHAQMAAMAGIWTIDFDTLNYLRSFTVSGTQVTVTTTSTVVSVSTPTNVFTNTIRSTVTDVATSVRTTTVPTRNARTRTITPDARTSVVTRSLTKTKWTTFKLSGTFTKTKTIDCIEPTRKRDHPGRKTKSTRTSSRSSSKIASVAPTARPSNGTYFPAAVLGDKKKNGNGQQNQRGRGREGGRLFKRAPGTELTTTITAPNTVTSTETAAATVITVDETVFVSTTSTVVSTSTVYSGRLRATVTARVPTRTRTSRAYVTVTSTKTLQYTKRVIELSTTPAPAKQCLARGGKRKEREDKREEKKPEYKPAPKGNAKKPEKADNRNKRMTAATKKIEKPRQTKRPQETKRPRRD